MNALKKASFGLVATAMAPIHSTFAAITTTNTSGGKLNSKLQGTSGDLSTAVQTYFGYITTFLYVIAVGYALYGGFLMLTSGGAEDAVKKGKTVIMHAALGLLVIFLASSIVGFILSMLGTDNKATTDVSTNPAAATATP